MNNRTVRVSILAAAAFGLALTQQACANGATPVAASGSSAPAPASSASAGPAAKTSGSTTKQATKQTTKTAAVPACKSADMAVDVTLQPVSGSANERRALVTVTNDSKRACKVEGRAAISLVDPTDSVVDVPTKEVDEPGAAIPITLKPGRTAFQGIKWTACAKSDAGCKVGNTLRFNLEASTDGPVAKLIGFPSPERVGITMKSLSIGTLQPSSQGVVAW